MDAVSNVKQLTLTAKDPQQMAQRLITFEDALRARAGTLLEVRWRCTPPENSCEAAVTYGLPDVQLA